MIWLTLRQHRWEAIATTIFVLGFAAVNLVASLRASSLIADFPIDRCISLGIFGPSQAPPFPAGSFGAGCAAAMDRFEQELGWLRPTPLGLLVLPVIVAPFIGAPLLAREYEFRTSLLVWAQGITRGRWLAAKLALIGVSFAAAALVVAIAVSGQVAWSYRPIPWFQSFEWSAPVLLGYTVVGLALGVFSGAVTRRVLAAMLVALLGAALIRAGVTSQLRPNYQPPIVTSERVSVPTDAWVLSTTYVDPQGTQIGWDRIIELQNQLFRQWGPVRGSGDVDRYLEENGARLRISYQPHEREVFFQIAELGVTAGLSAVLIVGTFWLVRRRPA